MGMIEPERAILADRALLARIEKLAGKPDSHPLAVAALEADIRYLRGLIDTYEEQFFDLHGIA